MDVTQMSPHMIQNTTDDQSSSTQLIILDQSASNDLFLVTILLIIGPGTILSNLLMIHVIYRMYMPKLRKTTRLLLGYVSTSHCVLGAGTVARLFNAPCSFLALLAFYSGTNILFGQFFLACEVLVMVLKPYGYQKIITFPLCKLAIFLITLLTIGIFPSGYMTLKEPSEVIPKDACYITNGMFNSFVLTITTSIVEVLVIITAVIQAYVLLTMRIVAKKTAHHGSTVANLSSSSQPVPPPNMLNPNQGDASQSAVATVSGKKTRLHRLTVILATSLLCFIVCWSPTLIGIIVFSVCELLHIHELVIVASQVMPKFSALIMINGVLHVGVYVVMSTQIRHGMKDFIKGCFCKT